MAGQRGRLRRNLRGRMTPTDTGIPDITFIDLTSYAGPQSSPHFAIASKLLNSLACEMALAKAVMSGASRCSGMLGMSS